MLKNRLIILLIFVIMPTFAFAEEHVIITTYFPSPYGSFREMVIAERMAVGDLNGDSKVDSGDLMVEPTDGFTPIRGSLTVAKKLSIGRVAPWCSFEMRSGLAPDNASDATFRILAVDPLPAQGGAAGPAGTNRSPAIALCRHDGGPIGAMGMAGFYNAWVGGSSPGDFVFTTGNFIGGNFLIGTANANELSRARIIIAPNGRIGIGGYYGAVAPPMPAPEALLDVRGQNEVILVPRSATEPPFADTGHADGAIYFNTALGKFQVHERGAFRDMGGNGDFPAPDYDSGWVATPRGNTLFTHNLNTENTMVYLEGRMGGNNIHQIRYGGDDTSGDSHSGMHWAGKTATTITVSRWDDDDPWQETRVRMWKITEPIAP